MGRLADAGKGRRYEGVFLRCTWEEIWGAKIYGRQNDGEGMKS